MLKTRAHRPMATTPKHAVHTSAQAVLLAAAALSLGMAVYVLDRQAPALWLWPASWALGSAGSAHTRWFGSAGEWLPSAVHAYAFCMLSLALLRPAAHPRAQTLAVCCGWWLLGSAFELAQHPSWSHRLAAALPAWAGHVPVLDHLGAYVVRGTFDQRDLAATSAGCLAAGVNWRWLRAAAGREGERT